MVDFNLLSLLFSTIVFIFVGIIDISLEFKLLRLSVYYNIFLRVGGLIDGQSIGKSIGLRTDLRAANSTYIRYCSCVQHYCRVIHFGLTYYYITRRII